MKRIITTAIMAMLLSLGIASAQEKSNGVIYVSAQEKNNGVTYVINHKVVASDLFDGSQLMNKTIASYQVDSERGLHIIFTSDYTKEKKVYQTKVETKDDDIMVVSYANQGNTVGFTTVVSHPETVFVVDGKITSSDEFKSIPPSKIASFTVIKSKDTLAFKEFAKASTEMVIIISTKK